VYTIRFEVAATTETDADPVRPASVAVNVAVSAVTSLTDAVATPAENETVAGYVGAVPSGLSEGPEKTIVWAPVYVVSFVTPLVVAVNVTLNAVPAVLVPVAGATVNAGGAGVVAENPTVGTEFQADPTRASTVYV
jgi:hypothetical protein